jgi:hypothetical protein
MRAQIAEKIVNILLRAINNKFHKFSLSMAWAWLD